MKDKYVLGLVVIDAVLGFVLMILNFTTNSLSVYNYAFFVVIAYLYCSQNYNRMFIPYFILQFFVFSLVLINRLFPNFLNRNDPFVNITISILGIVAVIFMLYKAFKIKRNNSI
ncbi:hypothetical protein PMSD_01845 [Paenibacillus macquariensis subsp. defensor]|nr:hypothetical protein PMSD_01845 [Paenibacillus macquariensis subsp. defensor]